MLLSFIQKIISTILLLSLCTQVSFAQQSKPLSKLQIAKNNAPKQNLWYKVIGIKDGDTIQILVDGKSYTIRLGHIDCPEKSQDFGNKAKQFVSDYIFGQMIQVQHQNNFDRNYRLIAEIILKDGQNLNQLLVKNGLAWHYTQYSSDTKYAQLEQKARSQKIGIWSYKNPIAPWEFRAQKKKKRNT